MIRTSLVQAVLTTLLVVGCAPLCGNSSVAEALRPGGPYRAVVFVRNCGATTSWSTHVSLLGIKVLSGSDTGNIFIADGSGPADPGVVVRWVSRDELEVSHASALRVFKAEPRWEAIRISYLPH